MEMEEVMMLENSLLWIFLYLPLAVLVVLCVLCLARLPGSRRRGLLPAALAVGLSATVLFGGEWLLNRCGLTWRTNPKLALCAVTWASGLAAGVLTVRCVMLDQTRPKLALWGTALALYCLISVMAAGTFLGAFWASGPEEKVGTWQGRMVIQGDWDWMETTYDIYEYHGPLARGLEPLTWSEDPLLEEEK